MKFYAQIDKNCQLIPCTDFDKDSISKIKRNESVCFEVKKQRNINFHRKFFVLINLLFENQENYKNINDFRHDLTIAAGFCEESINYFTGEVRLKAKSIAFSNMDELEFAEVYKRVIDKALESIPIDRDDLIKEIEQYF